MTRPDPRALCPCGTGEPYGECCAPYLAGSAAPTAQALMRSRYTAYVVGEIDYLVATHDETSRAQVDVAATEAWSRETQWQGLDILDVVDGGATDATGIVEFIARGVTRGAPFAQRERSRFRKLDGRWYYLDGQARREPVRKVAAPGPNEPCACGSGRKYKRCHGAAG
ncbi:MAG: YchJ family protein [Myxococcales bacterium]|jgi:SEC-C motif-containing protein|nr:YchJ family protein [Myxococcales bacterium]